MHDVLVHYLEVNFPEIAEQLAHARAREPSNEERAAAAERLRELIRRLRRGAAESGTAWHEPRASAAEMIAGVNGELSPDERAVLDHSSSCSPARWNGPRLRNDPSRRLPRRLLQRRLPRPRRNQ